jgi:peptide/nickel transport system substrate-binding protein/oligopeptide transport system substrate-binding protein
MFEPLLGYGPGSTTLQPMLAKEMPVVSNDGKTYTFTLRDGVNFVKPDGSVLREMNADDVVDSLNRVLDPNFKPSPVGVATSFFGNIVGAADVIAGTATTASGIKALDAKTVQVDLVKADRTFMNVMASRQSSVVPKGTPHDAAVVAANPVGTGPYLLKSYVAGQGAVWVGNPHYWQAGQPYVSEIDFRVGVDVNAATEQVQAGTLDLMGSPIPSGSFTEITTDPALANQVVHHTLVETDYLFFDTGQPNDGPMSKQAVRQALEYAIDKQAIITIGHGAPVQAECIFPPDMPAYDPNCHPYEYKPDRARELLTQAGYPNGFSTTLFSDDTDPDPLVDQSIQQDLAAVGITATISALQFDSFLDAVETPHTAPMGQTGWSMDYPDPSNFIDPLFGCAAAVQGGNNWSSYCDPETDRMAAEARGMVDETARLAAYDAIQNRIMEAAPWVPLTHPQRYTLTSTRVLNFQLHPVWLFNLRDVQLKPGV